MEILKRDCDAVLIPAGTKITIPAGTQVTITQALGGSYTINIQGNLARIDGKDADALGLQPVTNIDDDNVAGGPVDEAKVWTILKTCYDPEIPTNIVDLGLIYECSISALEDGGNQVNIKMTLTAVGCGMGPVLVEDVRNKVLTVPNVTKANIELVFDPPWDQSMMSEEAKLRTGMMW
ncbi:MAG: hypothetical protein FD165_2089 [Gammaproteobacteria bacterium]|nr:MAG: hypothetical protein FD165_2089 [Gammaproteobacteria bacterium]TND03462.1 MAG: hypothetical protein FD120_1857 [Gammaproteobacteria bacterium]